MDIDSRISKIGVLLNQAHHCFDLISTREFTPPVKAGLKKEVKAILDEAKGEVDLIKQEIDTL